MEHRHPIKVAALRSGLSAHVIRMWERRYKAVTPARTSTNRRSYSDQDIDRLILLRRATEAGESIGQIAGLSDDDLRKIVEIDEDYFPSSYDDGKARFRDPQGGDYLKRCLEAAEQLDARALEDTLLEASGELSRPDLLSKVLEPLMYTLGDRWREGKLRVVHEHLASAIVRSFLGNLGSNCSNDDSAPGLVVTTPSGQVHEFGALMVAVAACSAGWNATYLGPQLPAEEIANAAMRKKASAVALSIIYPPDDPRLGPEVRKLRRMLDPNIVLMVGGRSAESYRESFNDIGVHLLKNIAGLGKFLHKLRQDLPRIEKGIR